MTRTQGFVSSSPAVGAGPSLQWAEGLQWGRGPACEVTTGAAGTGALP